MKHYRLVLERDDDPEDITWTFATVEDFAAAFNVAKKYDCGLCEEKCGQYEFDSPDDAINFIKEVYEKAT